MSDDSTAPDVAKDAAAALAWIRGFRRGATNDPPDNCPDLSFDSENSGSYSDGMRIGRLVRTGDPIDRSSTLVVKGCPDGTEVICVPEIYGVSEYDPGRFIKETTPLRRAIGSPANWRIYVPSMLSKNPGDCPFISVGIEPNCEITIDFSKGADVLSGRYGVGPFKETA